MYTTVEADLIDGRVKLRDAIHLPAKAHVLITLLPQSKARRKQKPDWAVIQSQLGKLRLRNDTVAWQRSIRSEWGEQ